MPERLVLQKLLNSALATAIVETGDDQVGGFVTDAVTVADLRTPQQLLAAYGVEGAPQFVDVVRFEQPRLASLRPPSDAPRPWPTFSNGFLRGDSLARVWTMSRARYPYGSEYWRLRSDGEQKVLSRYEGVARGWLNAKQWRPPSPMVGTLARWRGREFFADVVQESVQLTAINDEGLPGFQPVRPNVWSASVPLTDTEIFERVYTAELDGIPVRIVRTSGRTAELLLLTDDPDSARRVGAGLVESGVYEVVVDSARLANTRGVENQLAG
ncbi:hypothetical protein EV589_0746 [Mycobacterium sp. BK558]|uniref:Uncharacterized protein n=1 Tax=Mycolicibacterium chlorophenolicum TaxID=37916 RepID=A0A0J6VKV0_9MYCO|nr:hypothetical protein [Mycolicibacterium chlorophenolicum]KMO70073.1 hypothetical protein MCHLDSM_04958 [Mycolicibacterium chlorophenolicum]MBI5339050.1 hypothetical protein [Mycolicibacterium rufum]RZT25021.1 hypothetical protein EV589_0746 [Mycobacterium sp. BK558]